MGLREDLTNAVNGFFEGEYTVTEGTAIPDLDDISFGKSGRELSLAMLFVDIRESTKIVDAFRRTTAARMYKSFLHGVAKLARNRNGQLCSFNGDGVLAAFIGDRKNTDAVRTAMNLKWFGKDVLRPKMKKYFENNAEADDLDLDFGIGVHSGKVLVVRGGIKGENNNDLVWVGNATNYAVKYSSLGSSPYNIHVSETTYKQMMDEVKLVTVDGKEKNMWEYITVEDETVYRTSYQWSIS
jgi:class 3 adenylate cyclase